MGLLDALSSDDAKLGIALLSASGYSPTPMSFGQRLGGALGQFNADRQSSADRALKTKLLQSQIDENASQNLLRQGQLERQKRQDEYYLGGSVAPMTAPGAPGGPGSAAPGSVLKSAIGAPADAPPPGRGKFAEWSQQYGIPVDVLVSDYFSNGGKKIAEMLFERSKPDWQTSDGYTVNRNAPGFSGGFQPGITTSANGTSTLRLPDPSAPGGVRIQAPQGALGTAGAYADQDARIRASNTPGRPTILPGGRMGGQSQYDEIRGGPATAAPTGSPTSFTGLPPAQAGVTGNFGGDQSRIIAAIADIKDPQERSNALAAFEQQMKAAPASQVAGGGLEFSPDEKTAQAAAQARAVDASKADVVRDSAKQTDVKTATKFLNIVGQIEDVFKQGPTNSGIGAAYDATAAVFGATPKGAEAAQRLKGLGGWLVANVPRMEGPQSNFDVANYQVMAGDVANEKLPLSRRMAALDSIKTMMQGVAGIQPTAPSNDGAAPKSFKEFGYSSQADVIKDAQNTILRNPKAKPEVMRRLKEMGISLNEGAW